MKKVNNWLDGNPLWLFIPITLVWAAGTGLVGYIGANLISGEAAFNEVPHFLVVDAFIAVALTVFNTWRRRTKRQAALQAQNAATV